MAKQKQITQAQNPTVKSFIDALNQLEKGGSDNDMLSLFGDDCTVSNAQLDTTLQGREGAAQFWHDYRHTFKEITSTFTRITEAGDVAVLEWTSEGTLQNGQPVSYQGVSILTLNGDEISDFMAYFDSRHLTAQLNL